MVKEEVVGGTAVDGAACGSQPDDAVGNVATAGEDTTTGIGQRDLTAAATMEGVTLLPLPHPDDDSSKEFEVTAVQLLPVVVTTAGGDKAVVDGQDAVDGIMEKRELPVDVVVNAAAATAGADETTKFSDDPPSGSVGLLR